MIFDQNINNTFAVIRASHKTHVAAFTAVQTFGTRI